MKITIVFKKEFDEKVVTFDTRQLAKNYIRILKSAQTDNSDLSLLDIYYPEDLSDYIESVLDNKCVDTDFCYDYNEDVEKLIEETTSDVNNLLIKGGY
jgi:hypothetical protein